MKTNFMIVDEAYLNSISADNNCRFDVLKLRQELERKFGKISRVYYVTTLAGDNQEAYHVWLKREARFEVVVRATKPRKCKTCGSEHRVEKGVDVFMATAAIKYAAKDRYERLLLVNGDGDLADALLYIRDDLNKEIVVIGSPETMSADTKLIAEEFVDVTESKLFTRILKDS